ncbi:MAG: hypothetical protein K6T17_07465 [Fimbriimonadales bacterium]|nr:hypothetical protein [Fimbriimonadales bacterium]
MAIRRDGRKPKRRRTVAQRLKGRLKPEFVLPPEPSARNNGGGEEPRGEQKPRRRTSKKP